MNLSQEEQRLSKDAQKALNAAKAAMRDAAKATRAFMEIQEAAGRSKEHAAAYAVWVEMDGALNGIHRAHSAATTALVASYDDSGVVVFGGGGR